MGAWFWWQFQQLTTPAVSIAKAPLQVAASTPAKVSTLQSEVASAPAAESLTVSAPATKSASAPVASDKPAANPKVAATTPHLIAKQPQIERQTREAAIPAPLEAAWNAFQDGDLVTAEKQYRRMLNSDPRNRDAWLGLAAIAARQNRKQDAIDSYRRLLTLNPQDADAQAGLLAIDPENMGERHEAQLLQQSERSRSPLALAQYYASRNRWHEAQEQYFQAFAQDPGNADLAFNLAICLDHIGQPKLAAEYYRKALTLKRGTFDRGIAETRLAEIEVDRK